MRYCADMMVSGHTYFAALFSLAAYKLTAAVDFHQIVQRSVGVVCIICLVVEMILVAAARFHYTVDMLVSVLLVCLLWDSLFLEQIASDLSEGFHWRDPDWLGSEYRHPFLPTRLRLSKLSAGHEVPPQPRVLPSNAKNLVNMRMLSGRPPWDLGGVSTPDNPVEAEVSCTRFPWCHECEPLMHSESRAQP